MFCYQCQETLQGKGCTKNGACGKKEDVAVLQDLLIYLIKGISASAIKAREEGVDVKDVNDFVVNGLFSTITNVNFDREYFKTEIKNALAVRDKLNGKIKNKVSHDSATWTGNSLESFIEKAHTVGVESTKDADIRSLRELLIYGVKGIAAYLSHAANLGYYGNNINEFIYKAMAATINDSLSVDDLIPLVLECGKFGVDALALLDKANTEKYGHPEITEVNIGVGKNPGILISGHDLKDLDELLTQTQGTGVDVYTHGEMLPAQYYPYFKKFKNFAGNYGSAWWAQKEEFDSFNGPILMTTNCIVPPKNSYIDRMYTTGCAGYEGVKYIADGKDKPKDFSGIIAQAKKCKSPVEIETGKIVGGFAHNAVFNVADKVVEAVKSGAIKRFFVMAGCDGRQKDRSYYTEFAEALPKDTVILTAGCAKYRYNKLNLGDIGGIPRVLDAGQCNDSYSLAVIALKLKEVFGLDDINKLPISYNIAWYEQKAVIVLLALLYLGVKNIHLGPTLPAFLSENVAKVLIEKFGIAGIKDVDSDIKMFMS